MSTLIRVRVPDEMLVRLRMISHELAFDGNLSQTVLHCTRAGLLQAEVAVSATKGSQAASSMAETLLRLSGVPEGLPEGPASTRLDTMGISRDIPAGSAGEEIGEEEEGEEEEDAH